MNCTLYARLYERLAELVPNLPQLKEGATFFAPSRVPGDMSLYCTVSKVYGPILEIELAHDQVVRGEDQPAPWMVFRVDTISRTAEMIAVQDEWRYEVVYSDSNQPNPRRVPMNMFAVNWLTIMVGLYVVFQPIEVTAAV